MFKKLSLPSFSLFKKSPAMGMSLFKKSPAFLNKVSNSMPAILDKYKQFSNVGNKIINNPITGMIAKATGQSNNLGLLQAGLANANLAMPLVEQGAALASKSTYTGQSGGEAARNALERAKTMRSDYNQMSFA